MGHGCGGAFAGFLGEGGSGGAEGLRIAGGDGGQSLLQVDLDFDEGSTVAGDGVEAVFQQIFGCDCGQGWCCQSGFWRMADIECRSLVIYKM